MPKSPAEIIKTWPKWKQRLAGAEIMGKSLSENVIAQFKNAMKAKNINQTELGVKMGATPANVSRFLSTSENLTLKTLERIANAIGGEIEIKFIPSKTEIELLKEEIERLKKTTWRKALRRKRHAE